MWDEIDFKLFVSHTSLLAILLFQLYGCLTTVLLMPLTLLLEHTVMHAIKPYINMALQAWQFDICSIYSIFTRDYTSQKSLSTFLSEIRFARQTKNKCILCTGKGCHLFQQVNIEWFPDSIPVCVSYGYIRLLKTNQLITIYNMCKAAFSSRTYNIKVKAALYFYSSE